VNGLQITVKNLEKELLLLKRELAMHDTLANRSQVSYEPLSEQQRYEIRQQVRAYLDDKNDDIDVRYVDFSSTLHYYHYYAALTGRSKFGRPHQGTRGNSSPLSPVVSYVVRKPVLSSQRPQYAISPGYRG